MNDRKVNVNCNPFGCVLFCIAIFLLVFFLTHVGPLWAALSKAIGS
jgi:hypothetical protein